MRGKALSDQQHHQKNAEDFHAIVTEYTWNRLACWKKIEWQNVVRVFVIFKGRGEIAGAAHSQVCILCVFVQKFRMVRLPADKCSSRTQIDGYEFTYTFENELLIQKFFTVSGTGIWGYIIVCAKNGICFPYHDKCE